MADAVGPALATQETSARRSAGGITEIWRRFARNRLAVLALLYLLLVYALAVFAPQVTRYEPESIDLRSQLRGPSPEHLLGTDENGRDVFTRLLYGARISLSVGVAAVAISVVVGCLVGASAGYFGGALDHALMRVTDGMLSIPLFFLWLMALASLGPTLPNIILVIGLTSWMPIARVVRGEVLRTRHLGFVEASRATGASDVRILWRHILPQVMPAMIVAVTLGVAYAVLTESALSFLGLGVQPPTPSWGNMLSGAQLFIWNSPQLAFYPGVLIFLTVLAFNSLGDALRDALDPQLG